MISRLAILSGIWYMSIKIPQNGEVILQICGALLSTILLVLFPILIFNKVNRHSSQTKYSWVRWVNWVVFAVAVALGGVGMYCGIA